MPKYSIDAEKVREWEKEFGFQPGSTQASSIRYNAILAYLKSQVRIVTHSELSCAVQDAVVKASEREKSFREAISKVCAEHGAEMDFQDDARLIVRFNAIFDGGGYLVCEHSSFDW